MMQYDCIWPCLFYEEMTAKHAPPAAGGWVEQIGCMEQVARDLGQSPAAYATPADAVVASGKWIIQRIDPLIAVPLRLIEMWLDHARRGLVKAIPTGEKRKHDHDG